MTDPISHNELLCRGRCAFACNHAGMINHFKVTGRSISDILPETFPNLSMNVHWSFEPLPTTDGHAACFDSLILMSQPVFQSDDELKLCISPDGRHFKIQAMRQILKLLVNWSQLFDVPGILSANALLILHLSLKLRQTRVFVEFFRNVGPTIPLCSAAELLKLAVEGYLDTCANLIIQRVTASCGFVVKAPNFDPFLWTALELKNLKNKWNIAESARCLTNIWQSLFLVANTDRMLADSSFARLFLFVGDLSVVSGEAVRTLIVKSERYLKSSCCIVDTYPLNTALRSCLKVRPMKSSAKKVAHIIHFAVIPLLRSGCLVEFWILQRIVNRFTSFVRSDSRSRELSTQVFGYPDGLAKIFVELSHSFSPLWGKLSQTEGWSVFYRDMVRQFPKSLKSAARFRFLQSLGFGVNFREQLILHMFSFPQSLQQYLMYGDLEPLAIHFKG